jgi:hypothetical protein
MHRYLARAVGRLRANFGADAHYNDVRMGDNALGDGGLGLARALHIEHDRREAKELGPGHTMQIFICV